MNELEAVQKAASEFAQNMDPAKTREANIDTMYNDFMNNAEKDTYMTLSEFKKYEPLYSLDTRKRMQSNEATEEERQFIVNLSEEFYRRINTQRPLHIVDDYTGKEVCPPLPPIFRRLNNLSNQQDAEVTEIFARVSEQDDTSNPMAYTRKQVATDNLYRQFVAKQDAEELNKDIANFDAMTKKFHSEYLHEDISKTTTEATPSPAPTETHEEIDADDAYLDFDE